MRTLKGGGDPYSLDGDIKLNQTIAASKVPLPRLPFARLVFLQGSQAIKDHTSLLLLTVSGGFAESAMRNCLAELRSEAELSFRHFGTSIELSSSGGYGNL